MDRCGSGQGQVAGTCKSGNDPSGYIKGRGCFDQLRTDQLLKNGSANGVSKYGVNIVVDKYLFSVKEFISFQKYLMFSPTHNQIRGMEL